VNYIYFRQNEWRHFWHSFQIREKASLRVPVEPNSDLSRLIPYGVTMTYLSSLEVASLSVNNHVSNVPPRKIHVTSPLRNRVPLPLWCNITLAEVAAKWLKQRVLQFSTIETKNQRRVLYLGFLFYCTSMPSLISRRNNDFFFHFCASTWITTTYVSMKPTKLGLEEPWGQIHK